MKLVCINIEKSNHLERVEKFVTAQQPDVVLLQEVMAHDLPRLQAVCGEHVYMQNMVMEHGKPLGPAILSKYPLENCSVHYYAGAAEDALQELGWDENKHPVMSTIRRMMLRAEVTIDGTTYPVATTHFTWTAEGASTPLQLTDTDTLLSFIDPQQPLLLAGDFNAPRGKETADKLCKMLTNHIPDHYTTSIDGSLHRAGQLPFMVDYIFTTTGYKVENVEFHTGVSDHRALTADVYRT